MKRAPHPLLLMLILILSTALLPIIVHMNEKNTANLTLLSQLHLLDQLLATRAIPAKVLTPVKTEKLPHAVGALASLEKLAHTSNLEVTIVSENWNVKEGSVPAVKLTCTHSALADILGFVKELSDQSDFSAQSIILRKTASRQSYYFEVIMRY